MSDKEVVDRSPDSLPEDAPVQPDHTDKADADALETVPAEGETSKCTQVLERLSQKAHHGLESAFAWIGSVVVGHPGLVIIGVVLLTVAMAQGVWLYDEELAPEKLWTPAGSEAQKDQVRVKNVFGYNANTLSVYYMATGGNILTKPALTAMMNHHNLITTQLETEGISYETVCLRYPTFGTCREASSPLALWDFSPAVLAADPNPLATINTPGLFRNKTGEPSIEEYLSRVERDPATGAIVAAAAAATHYQTKNEKVSNSWGGFDDPETRKFEMAASDAGRLVEGGPVRIFTQSESVELDAQTSAMNDDVSLLIFGYVLMVGYTVLILSRGRVQYSHSLMGVASVVTVMLAVTTAFGFCWFVGVEFNVVVRVSLLVLLGVGVDDTFVIMDSWWDNAHLPNMKDRMVKALSEAGPAITLTSVTDLIAFLAGSATDVPSIRSFCFYASAGITVTFLYQCTFLVALVYLDSRRQANGKADVLCCVSVGEETGCFVSPTTRSPPLCKKDAAERPWRESDRGLQNYFVGTLLPQLTLSTRLGKGVVLVVSAVFVALGIYGCTQVRMNYNTEWLVDDSHFYKEVLEFKDEYFDGTRITTEVYFGDLDYTDTAVQDAVEAMALSLERNPWIVKNTTVSWLRQFHEWSETPEAVPHAGKGFYDRVAVFVNTTRAGRSQDVNLRWRGGKIIASRVSAVIVGKTLADGLDAVDALDSLRADADAIKLPAGNEKPFAYTFVFIFWESYKIIIPETAKNVAIAGVCVFVIIAVIVANVGLGLLVVLSIGCVDVCLIGFMPFLGIEMNGVTIVCIVLAIGLAVDYSVHIAGVFIQVKATETNGHSPQTLRAAYALWKMGPAVINGGTSTFIAVSPLMLAKTYSFKVFFKMFAMIIFFGLFFGVIMMPVVMCLFGPRPLASALDLDTHPWMSPLHPDYHTSVHEDPEAAETSSTVNRENEPDRDC